MTAFRNAFTRFRAAKFIVAGVFFLLGIGAIVFTTLCGPNRWAAAFSPTDPPNTPIGVGKGIHPGRVAWVRDINAVQGEVNWDNSTGYYWDDEHNNQPVIDAMMGKTVRWLTGETTDLAAWNALFHSYNSTHNKGNVGYQPGEKIIIKVNLNNAIDWTFPGVTNDNFAVNDPSMYQRDVDNESDVTPQAVIALLRQLIQQAGVPASSIYITDSIRYWTDKYWVRFQACPELEGVHFMDCMGLNGREKIVKSATPAINYSIHDGTVDYIPAIYQQADYMINFATLKKTSIGITCCNKNHYGSLCVSPSHVHQLGWDNNLGYAKMGDYSCFTDYMAHKDIGGKTFLYLLDGLWAGWFSYGVQSMPHKWTLFNNDWPKSFFASQDPVAIDSVALDFLRNESPGDNGSDYSGIAPGSDNYLHEAALADNPPSHTVYCPDGTPVTQSLGVHEHWDNATDKKYSRNLGTGNGIELVSTDPDHAPVAVDDNYQVLQGHTLSASRSVCSNDSDVDGNTLQAVQVSDTSHGSLTLYNDGTFTYQPNPAFIGTDTFTYKAYDGDLYSNDATVTIVVAPNPLSGVTLTTNVASPQPINTRVTLHAQPINGSVVEYKFRSGYKDGTGWHWSDLSTYSFDPICTWTPRAVHSYTLVVWAREVGHTANYDVYASIPYQAAPVLSGVNINCVPAAQETVNTPITLTGRAQGGAHVEMKFQAGYQDVLGWHWENLTAYSSVTSCVWRPSDPHTYTLAIWAREQGHTQPYDCYATTNYVIAPVVTAVSLAASPRSMCEVDATATFTASTTGGAAVEYCFRAGYQDASGWHWRDIQQYSLARTCKWTPSEAHRYTVTVWAREAGHRASYEAYQSINYSVTRTINGVNLVILPRAKQLAYTQATFKAIAVGGTNVEYAFKAGTKDATGWHWTELQSYRSANLCYWTPTDPGVYTILVYVREVGHTTPYDQYTTGTYTATAE